MVQVEAVRLRYDRVLSTCPILWLHIDALDILYMYITIQLN